MSADGRGSAAAHYQASVDTSASVYRHDRQREADGESCSCVKCSTNPVDRSRYGQIVRRLRRREQRRP